MSFCEKCGKQLAEGETCSCQTPEKKKFNPAIIVLAVILLAVVALVVALIANAGGSSSKSKKNDKEKEEKSTYMDPIDNYLAVVNKKNSDIFDFKEAMMPDFAVKKFHAMMEICAKSDYYGEDIEDMSDDLADYYDDCDDEFDTWKITFEKKEAEKLDEDTLDYYKELAEDYYEDDVSYMVESLEEMMDDDGYMEDIADMLELSEEDTKELVECMLTYYKCYEEVKVTAGYEVTGKFVLKAEGETYETDKLSFVVLKINGSWVYMGLADYGYLGFEGEDSGVFSFFFREIRSSKFKAENIF